MGVNSLPKTVSRQRRGCENVTNSNCCTAALAVYLLFSASYYLYSQVLRMGQFVFF